MEKTHEELQQYYNETVWRLQEDDIRMVLDEDYPNLTEDQREYLVDRARYKLEIDWVGYIQAFIDARIDEVE